MGSGYLVNPLMLVINTLFDDLLPAGLQNYWKGNFARDLPSEAIDVHIAHGAKTPTLESGGFIFPVNGACHRVAPEETAYGGRGADKKTHDTCRYRQKNKGCRTIPAYGRSGQPVGGG